MTSESPYQRQPRRRGLRLLNGRTRPQLVGLIVVGISLPIVLLIWWLQAPSPVATATPVDYGAVGDGVTDDTAALQRTFDAVAEGGTVVIPEGRTFAHSQVLTLSRKNMRLTGRGTLLATRQETSEVWVRADGIGIEQVTFAIGETTRRWDAYEQMKLRIGRTSGVTVTDVTIDGSAASGVFVGGATNFQLSGVRVLNTRADGIHMTEGSSDGIVTGAVVSGTGDDGIAVVSYSDFPVCSRIAITNVQMLGQQWGRAFSVVGGEDIVLSNFYAEYSSAAGLYVASEANYNTLPVARVTVTQGRLVASNQNATIDHGAVLLFNGQSGTVNRDIDISDLEIIDTRATASRNVGLINDPGASHSGVNLSRFIITGGPQTPFATNASADAYRLTEWRVDGLPWPLVRCPFVTVTEVAQDVEARDVDAAPLGGLRRQAAAPGPVCST